MSKPKPSLAKGVVRTLASSSSVSSSAPPLHLAPVVSSHSQTASSSFPTSASTSTSSSSSSSSRRQAVPQQHPFLLNSAINNNNNNIVNAPSTHPSAWALQLPFTNISISQPSTYLPLLPTWDATTYDPSTIIQPYRHSRLRRPSSSRSYTTLTPPNLNVAFDPTSLRPHLPPIPPSLLAPDKPSNLTSYDAGGDGAYDLNALLSDLFAPPPPPPSPPPSSQHAVRYSPRSESETHTVLSPAPLPTASNAGSLTLGSTSSSSYLSPTSVELLATSHLLAPSPDAPSHPAPTLYSSSLIFHLGASGLAKDRPPPPPRPFASQTPSSSRDRSPTPPPRPRSFPIPEIKAPEKLHSVAVGEDAYFARLDGMCVADGVGGWARSGRGGADAGRWSRLLAHFCEGEVAAWWAGEEGYLEDLPTASSSEGSSGRTVGADPGDQGGVGGWARRAWRSGMGREKDEGWMSGVVDEGLRGKGLEEGKRRRKLDPVEIMQRGFEKCLGCVSEEGVHGSSTCLLALLHHSTLLVANLGDCCLLLIRGGQVVFRTSEMQHAFNFPLQLGTHSRDEPMKDAKRYDVPVGRGDVVVVGSDGLMDNLFDEDILETIAEFAPPSSSTDTPSSPLPPTPPSSRPSSPTSSLPPFSPQKVSEALCAKARAVSEQTSATTPFMCRAIEEGIDFVGGKKDDISVLVGVIGDRDASITGNGLALHSH